MPTNMRIAVLTTSDLQPTGIELNASSFLRNLVLQGFRVVVVTTRPSVNGYLDICWKRWVEKEDIFVPDLSESCGEQHKHATCKCYLENWKNAYEHLGETWDESYTNWIQAWDGLSKLGYVTSKKQLDQAVLI